MQKLAERPKAKKALMVTGLVLAVAGGVALAERNRRRALAAKEHNDSAMPDPRIWGVVGYSDL